MTQPLLLPVESHSPKRISGELMKSGKKAKSCVATVTYSFNRTVPRGPRIGHTRNAERSCSKELVIQWEQEGTTGAGKGSLPQSGSSTENRQGKRSWRGELTGLAEIQNQDLWPFSSLNLHIQKTIIPCTKPCFLRNTNSCKRSWIVRGKEVALSGVNQCLRWDQMSPKSWKEWGEGLRQAERHREQCWESRGHSGKGESGVFWLEVRLTGGPVINEVVNAGSRLRMENLKCYAKELPEIRGAETERTMV